MSKIGINYVSFLNQSGYSQAAQDYIIALQRSGKYDIKVNGIGARPSAPQLSTERIEMLQKLMANPSVPNSINIVHCIPTMQARYTKNGFKTLGFATYETYDPPANWFNILNSNHGIITPSKFNHKIFSVDTIQKPVFYVPHCFDVDVYNSDVKPMYQYDKFSFLFMGTWKIRKGYPQLIEAFLNEFSDQDKVQLVIKTDRFAQAEQYINNIKRQIGNKGFPTVLFEHKVFDEKSVASFMKSFDCFIVPTLGEGFGLPGLQSMALKVPVIITNFSGCQDYANEQTATLLEPEGFVLHSNMDSVPQFLNKKWAFLSAKQIREKMRYAFDNQNIISQKAELAYNFVRENFNYTKVENIFSDIIGQTIG